jgi:hypothetical protein
VNKLTDKPLGINVRVAREQPDAPYLIDAIIEERKKNPSLRRKLNVVITSAGNPELYTEKLKDAELQVWHVMHAFRFMCAQKFLAEISNQLLIRASYVLKRLERKRL